MKALQTLSKLLEVDFFMGALCVMTLLFLIAAKNEHPDAGKVRQAQARARAAIEDQERLAGQIDTYQAQIAKRDDQMRGMSREVSVKDQQNRRLQSANADLGRQVQGYADQIATFKDKFEQYDHQIAVREASIDARDATIRGITDQVSQLTQENQRLTDGKALLEGQAADANETAQGYADQIASLKDELAESRQTQSELNLALTQLSEKLRALSVSQKRKTRDVVGLAGQFKRVAFVIDTSESMNTNRFPALKNLVALWLQHLDFEHFHLVSFSTEVTVHNPVLKQATDANRGWAAGQVAAFTAEGNTATHEALTTALTKHVDTIVFFSDGAPSDGAYTKILEDVRRMNQGRTVINVIATGDYFEKDYGTFLRLLAEQNGGQFLGR